MLQSLKEVQLVVHHLLVALDALLQNNLNGHLAGRAISLAHDTVCASTEGSSEPVLCSVL